MDVSQLSRLSHHILDFCVVTHDQLHEVQSQDFPTRFPQGALFPLEPRGTRGTLTLRGTLLVAPARPQAADFWCLESDTSCGLWKIFSIGKEW